MDVFPLTFVLLHFTTLGRLVKRIEHLQPGIIYDLWRRTEALVLVNVEVFPRRSVMLKVATVCPQEIPVHLLGDDQVAALVAKLHKHWSAPLYRQLHQANHGPLT